MTEAKPLKPRFPLRTQPPTVACKMEAQLESAHNAYNIFFARLAPICMLRRCLLTKFLVRSSVGSLLRVRCWLGSSKVSVWRSGHIGFPFLSLYLVEKEGKQKCKANNNRQGGATTTTYCSYAYLPTFLVISALSLRCHPICVSARWIILLLFPPLFLVSPSFSSSSRLSIIRTRQHSSSSSSS